MVSLKTIGLLFFIILITSFQVVKKTLTVKPNFPNKWTRLERSENGYVVYQPCDGSTPTIEIKHLDLAINWQLEREEHNVKDIIRVSDTTFEITCDDSQFNIKVKWLDKEKTRALWKFQYVGDSAIIKWVMCPTKLKTRFPYVDNPCPTEMKFEKIFLPVNID
jgi:hypothetical protein